MKLSDSPALASLGYLTDQRTVRDAVQKAAMTSRSMDRKADDKADDKAWTACKKAVDRLDKHRCRKCGRKVEKVLRLCAERAEHHHVTKRVHLPDALMNDVRCVLLLCNEHHDLVTRGKLHIVGTARQMFTHESKSYLNARLKLRFV